MHVGQVERRARTGRGLCRRGLLVQSRATASARHRAPRASSAPPLFSAARAHTARPRSPHCSATPPSSGGAGCSAAEAAWLQLQCAWSRRDRRRPAGGVGTSADTADGVGLTIRGPANLAGAWLAQPVPASPRPPRATHRPTAACAPRAAAEGEVRWNVAVHKGKSC